MKPIVRGLRVAFGIQPIKPVANLPQGRVRFRMRNAAVTRAFVKTASGIRKFFMEDRGDHWFAHEEGRNERREFLRTYPRGVNVARALQLNPRIAVSAA